MARRHGLAGTAAGASSPLSSAKLSFFSTDNGSKCPVKCTVVWFTFLMVSINDELMLAQAAQLLKSHNARVLLCAVGERAKRGPTSAAQSGFTRRVCLYICTLSRLLGHWVPVRSALLSTLFSFTLRLLIVYALRS